MAASDHVSQHQRTGWYHGTNADLKPGDHLVPGHGSNFGVAEDKSYVHVTTDKANARGYGDWAATRAANAKRGIYPHGFSPLDHPDADFGPATSRTYEVAPTGPVEHDNSTLPDQHRTTHPVRVLREVTG